MSKKPCPAAKSNLYRWNMENIGLFIVSLDAISLIVKQM
jgi:hypothetical protein